jgi:hypothetical protein
MAAVLAAVGAAGSGAPAAAAAYCVSAPTILFVEFAPGSAELPPPFELELVNQLLSANAQKLYADEAAVLTMGDIAEGADWQAASGPARAADKALGEARMAAVQAVLARLPPALRPRSIKPHVRDNRQLLKTEDIAANPRLNDRLRGGISLTMASRAPPTPGVPQPLC